MDSETILSFSTPLKPVERVDVFPSPVLELVYACYYLSSPKRRTGGPELSWAQAMEADHAGLLGELRSFWPDIDQAGRTGFELFVAACQLGYARDPSPKRFLKELPEAPRRLLKLYEQSGSDERHDEKLTGLVQRLEELDKTEVMARYQPLFERLWAVLEPYWRAEGHDLVLGESRRFGQQLEAGESVLNTLPKHYFARTEKLAEQIGQFSQSGQVAVMPLYFSSGGGFALDFANTLYLGYSLQSESRYHKIASQTQELAQRLKAFGDPTRLLVLALLGQSQVTVGDLAERLEVSQPTISGHLKLLRDAGLVEVEKSGNKSFYKVQKEAVRALLAETQELLVGP